MKDYLASADRPLLQKHGLDNFAALWDLPLAAVDEPNVENVGWSSVARLELDGRNFFLKRQCNYFTRTLEHPWGEPTVAREIRNIMRYQRLGVPSLQAVFYAAQKVGRERRAILLTQALDGWRDLLSMLKDWPQTPEETRQAIVLACAALIGKLHAAGLRHGCLYPKHLFLRCQDNHWQGCLIDLEKTRLLSLTWNGRVKDLETFRHKVNVWGQAEQEAFLGHYLQASHAAGTVAQWQQRLDRRRMAKDKRL